MVIIRTKGAAMTKFTDNPAVQAMVVRMAKDKLPPGVKRATQQADKSALIASAKPARQAIQGYLGMDPSYSVMDPQAERLASAYRTGEATSVLGDLAGALSPFAYASALSKVGQVPGIAELIAYHGSPHKFKKFDASKIGTGEGIGAYGHGLYFAENPNVASEYRRKLSALTNLVDGDVSKSNIDAIVGRQIQALGANKAKQYFLQSADQYERMGQSYKPALETAAKYRAFADHVDQLSSKSFAQNKGSLYKVNIPDEKIAQMLDWDKPLSQQPKAVQEAINKSEYALRDMAMDLYGKKDPLGSEIARAALKPQEFAEHMKELGVPGIRYLDQGSRGTGKGTSNFVVFPGEEESIKMLEINGTPEMAAGGPVRMQDGGDPTARFMGKTKPQGIMQAKGFGEGPGMRPLQEAADVGRGLFGAEAIIPGGEGYRTGQALANMPAVGLAAVPGKVASALPDVATGLGALGAAGVIKPKGGNWLAGAFSAEQALKPLKRTAGARGLPADQVLAEINATYTPEAMAGLSPESLAQVERAYAELKPAAAINKWIDTKLTKYVKNEMATPEDPVRALAERGTLHFEPQDVPRPMGFEKDSRTLRESREAGGYPIEGLGKSNLAKDWEALADINIQPDKAEVFLPIKSELERNPWLEKVSPDTPVYGMNLSADMSRLGFPHIIDELTNALNPNSELPASLRLTPQQLEKVTVPQAVERVAKINEWRTEQAIKAEREGMLGNLQATPRLADKSLQLSFVDKPRGAWVDIPETTGPKGLALCTSIGRAGGWCTQGDYLAESYGSGENRLTALVDAEGRPHAQAKITENEWPVSGEGFTLLDPKTKAQYGQYVREWRQRNPEVEDLTDDDVIQALKEAGVKGPAPDITELKPPGNSFESERAMEYAKRDPDYKAKVTDSVVRFLNSGEWGDVKDLHHYDIIDLKRDKRMLDAYLRDITGLPSGQAAFEKAVKSQPAIPRFMTEQQLREFINSSKSDKGFARGGKVTFTNNPDVQAMVVKMAKELPKAVNKGKKYA